MVARVVLAAALLAVSATAPVAEDARAQARPAGELRCGWVDNPTPQNFWLTDREAEWAVSIQGGEWAEGWDEIEDFRGDDWVETNGSYGYGCACMRVDVDRETERVTRIYSARSVPVARCRRDRALPKR